MIRIRTWKIPLIISVVPQNVGKSAFGMTNSYIIATSKGKTKMRAFGLSATYAQPEK